MSCFAQRRKERESKAHEKPGASMSCFSQRRKESKANEKPGTSMICLTQRRKESKVYKTFASLLSLRLCVKFTLRYFDYFFLKKSRTGTPLKLKLSRKRFSR